MSSIGTSRFVERPFEERVFAAELAKFDNWEAKVQRTWQQTVEDCYHLRVGKDVSLR